MTEPPGYAMIAVVGGKESKRKHVNAPSSRFSGENAQWLRDIWPEADTLGTFWRAGSTVRMHSYVDTYGLRLIRFALSQESSGGKHLPEERASTVTMQNDFYTCSLKLKRCECTFFPLQHSECRVTSNLYAHICFSEGELFDPPPKWCNAKMPTYSMRVNFKCFFDVTSHQHIYEAHVCFNNFCKFMYNIRIYTIATHIQCTCMLQRFMCSSSYVFIACQSLHAICSGESQDMFSCSAQLESTLEHESTNSYYMHCTTQTKLERKER